MMHSTIISMVKVINEMHITWKGKHVAQSTRSTCIQMLNYKYRF